MINKNHLATGLYASLIFAPLIASASGLTTAIKELTATHKQLGLQVGDTVFVEPFALMGDKTIKLAGEFAAVRGAATSPGAKNFASITPDLMTYTSVASKKDGTMVLTEATKVVDEKGVFYSRGNGIYQNRVVTYELPPIEGAKVVDVKVDVRETTRIPDTSGKVDVRRERNVTAIGDVSRTLENGATVRESFIVGESGGTSLRRTGAYGYTYPSKSGSKYPDSISLQLRTNDAGSNREVYVVWDEKLKVGDPLGDVPMHRMYRRSRLSLPDDVKGTIIGMSAKPVGENMEIVLQCSDGKEYTYRVTRANSEELKFERIGFKPIQGGIASLMAKVKPLATRQDAGAPVKGMQVEGVK